MSNSEPDMFEIDENRRAGVTVRFVYNNVSTHLNAQYDKNGNLRVIKLFPKLKYGTDYLELLKEVSEDLTFRLQCYKEPGDALARMQSSVRRKQDGTPTTIRGAVIDRLFRDPYLEE